MTKFIKKFTFFASLTTASSVALAAPGLALPTKYALDNQSAHTLVEAAKREAVQRGTAGSIAVVDDGGHVIVLERMDKATPASAEIATAKARTAALFLRPTRILEKSINDGRQAAITSGFNMMSGGVPVLVNGQVIGAVGISTPQAPQDDPIAEAASHALDVAPAK